MDNPHVIIVVLDTLRKDYGRVIEKTLAKLGFITYENAIAPSPWTLPSHASLFSGLYPAFHGAHETREVKNYDVRFNGPNSLLRLFSERGYLTYLMSANIFVRPEFGFSGFDYFFDVYSNKMLSFFTDREKTVLSKYWGESENSKTGLIKKLVKAGQYKLLLKLFPGIGIQRVYAWYNHLVNNWPIEKGSGKVVSLVKRMEFREPTFLFINLMEVHQPLFINRRIPFCLNFKNSGPDPKLISLWREKYAEATSYLNSRLLELFDVLKRKGVFESSLIVVLSDHGELIGERGKVLHGTFLYDELLRVPFMVKYPSSWSVETGNENGYISLTSVPRFISSLLAGEATDSQLYSRTVFSESYGVSNSFDLSVLSEDELELYRFFNMYRIAVYRDNLKGVFNVREWKFEELVSYAPRRDISEEDVKELRNEVVGFLREVSYHRGHLSKLDVAKKAGD